VYTLLIVDDEPLSQVGLKSMVDWASLDVEIVGTAPNGLAALEEIGRLRPDIVIADLRMPMLDGLGLVERCRAEPDGGPAFIIVTGYADFDSLRRAMRGSVVDYLLKLELDEAALRASVEKAKAAVRERKRMGLSSPAGAVGGDPFAETALARLLSGSYADAEEARASLERSGLSLGPEGFRVALFKAEYAGEGRLSGDERLRAYCCAVDMVKQVVGREAAVMVVPFGVYSFAAVLGAPAAEGEAASDITDDVTSRMVGILDRARDVTSRMIGILDRASDVTSRMVGILDRARDVVEKYFGVSLRAGVGSERRESVKAAESYREAQVALGSASAERPIVAFERLRVRDPGSGAPRREGRRAVGFRDELLEALSSRQADSFRSVVGRALKELGTADVSLAEALALCSEILYPVLERLEGAQDLLDSLFPDESEGWRCLFSASNPHEAAAWLTTVGDGVGARLESAQIRGRNPLVSGVRKYVLENYASRLSLTEVARRFEVSPNHLSTLFKKYAGVGFADFVARVKVEKAKELIAGGRYKMFQVAQILGFEDAFYFSKVFKRVAGMSPRDFYLSRCEREPSTDTGELSASDSPPGIDE